MKRYTKNGDNMIKTELIEKIKTENLDLNKIIVIDNASLVLQDFIEETGEVSLTCPKDYYDKIDWEESIDKNFNPYKFCENYTLNYTYYDPKNIIEIEKIKVMDLEGCLSYKLLFNQKEDKKLIKDIDLYLCKLDNYRYERKLKRQGINLIAGVDEVGRGPLVGPVVAACVILPEEFELDGLTDSKKLSEKKREEFYIKIKEQALGIGVGIVDEKRIDELNIYEATKVAMKEAIANCNIKPEHILIDAMPLECDIPTTSIIKGDLKSITISAASVIAKVTRDHMLYELDKKYPMYDFKKNKGYPTKEHLEAIEKYGIINEHRKSYAPVATYLRNRGEVNEENI